MIINFHIPRILVAGVSSGVGKTTFVVGLVQAFKRRGLKVLTFKCGPDYLDPTYHQMSTGEKTYNLDSWILDQKALNNFFIKKSLGYDLVIIEGAMGLFDSVTINNPRGSSALVAKWTQTPTFLVVDASGMSSSLAAMVSGFYNFDHELGPKQKLIKGVLANRVGSINHLQLLKDVLNNSLSTNLLSPLLPPLVGGLFKKEKIFPERHLGLTTAFSSGLTIDDFSSLVSDIEKCCDLDKILSLAQSAIPLLEIKTKEKDTSIVVPNEYSKSKIKIAVAFDDAFHFYYEENLELLKREGAEIVFFSPLKDKSLPKNINGLIIGGGYPELYAKELSENFSLKESILELAVHKKIPIYAECGGLMYLSEYIQTLEGENFPMLGIIKGTAKMEKKLKALGYVEVVTNKDSILGPINTTFKGHQFRYSDLVNAIEDKNNLIFDVTKIRNNEKFHEGYTSTMSTISTTYNTYADCIEEKDEIREIKIRIVASYIHAYWDENSTIAKSFISACSSICSK
ncbi:MAG: cobyrinate a,c-diamide synthase [Oligoflexia bacterium]|nr:cobyrinate a,c-diamide synthase [Oligoflexia bacterium]